jgi:hypothetical protein
MASKRITSKRKKAPKRLVPSTQRQTTKVSDNKASMCRTRHSQTREVFWPVKRILQENSTHYEVEWEPTWEPHSYVTPDLEALWKEEVATQKASQETHERELDCNIGSGGQRSFQSASSREPEHTQGLVAMKPLTAGVASSHPRDISTVSLQPSKQIPGLLFVGPQKDGHDSQLTDLRSDGIEYESQSISKSSEAISTLLAQILERPSDVNQQTLVPVNSPHSTNEEISQPLHR